jgi:hypothetical protein
MNQGGAEPRLVGHEGHTEELQSPERVVRAVIVVVRIHSTLLICHVISKTTEINMNRRIGNMCRVRGRTLTPAGVSRKVPATGILELRSI